MRDETTALTQSDKAQYVYSSIVTHETTKLPVPVTVHTPEESTEIHGFMCMIACSFFFSIATFLTHMARSTFKFPHMPAVMIQATVQFTLSSTYIAISLGWRVVMTTLRPRQKLLLVFRGSAGSACMIILYNVLGKLPLGIVTSVFYVSPVFTMILSYITMGETIAAKDGVAAILSFVGIGLISEPSMHFNTSSNTNVDQSRLVWIALTLLAAFCAAAAYTTVRNLGSNVHFMLSVCALSTVNLCMCVCFGGIMSRELLFTNPEGTALLLLSSFLAFAGQCFMNRGLQSCKAGPGTLLRNIEIPMSYSLGIVFLKEAVSPICILGSMLVLLSSVTIGMG